MSDARQALGREAEERARRHLEAAGLTLLARNWKVPPRPGHGGHGGELDLVMRDGDVLVVVEVRSGSAHFAGAPAYTVGPSKQRRLGALAQMFTRQLDWRPRATRFDVVALTRGEAGWDLRWYKNALSF